MVMWNLNKLGCIPRSVGFVYSIGLGTVFILAVKRQDVTPYLPYISETGALPPESGLFSISLYSIATLGMVTMLLRYMIVEECNQGGSRVLTYLSRVSLFFGLLSMCGMVIVGAFPMLTVPPAHGVGALMLFTCCCVYGLMETIISFRMVPCHISRSTSIIRALITSLGALILIIMIPISSMGSQKTDADVDNNISRKKLPGDPGFEYIVAGAAAEWSLSLLFLAFFLTYVVEFRGVSVHIRVLYNPSNAVHPESEYIVRSNQVPEQRS